MQYENAVVLNIESLKSKHDENSLSYYIWSIALNCKKNSRAFWELEKSLRFKDRMISIPLLILSSASGITSVALQQSFSFVTADVMMALGVSSACLVAIHKITKYTERATIAKNIAKAYARISRRIETTMVLVESSVIDFEEGELLKFVRDVEKELDSILSEIDEVPVIPHVVVSIPETTERSHKINTTILQGDKNDEVLDEHDVDRIKKQVHDLATFHEE